MGCQQLGQLDIHKPCLSTSFSPCKGHKGPFQPWIWEGKVREPLCVQAPSSPAAQETKHLPEGLHQAKRKQSHHCPNAGSWSTPLLGCFLASHALGSTAQTQGERGQEKGASTACFPAAQPRNFFCVEQGLAHSSAEQLPHPPSGQGLSWHWQRAPCTASSRDREVVTRI